MRSAIETVAAIAPPPSLLVLPHGFIFCRLIFFACRSLVLSCPSCSMISFCPPHVPCRFICLPPARCLFFFFFRLLLIWRLIAAVNPSASCLMNDLENSTHLISRLSPQGPIPP